MQYTADAFPAASLARTASACGPALFTVPPLAKGAPSSVALTEERCASLALNEMLTGLVRISPSATPLMAITGGVVSRVRWICRCAERP